MTDSLQILIGDCRDMMKTLPDASVQCCVTSPPYYGLRDYGTAEWEGGGAECDHLGRRQTSDASTLGDWKNGGGKEYKDGTGGIPFRDVCGKCGAIRIDKQIGLEATPQQYIDALVEVFREVRRVLKDDGTLWLNLGDSYAASRSYQVTDNKNPAVGPTRHLGRAKPPDGLKQKDLIGIPWMAAFALRADGWYLRSDIIWAKDNPMPESVQGSHFSRHRVTIKEYEDLSGMQYTGERAGDDWAGDMPSLSEIEIPCSKAPLSAKREGNRNGKSARGTGRSKRETKGIQPFEAGNGQQEKIRADGEGQEHAKADDAQIPHEPARKEGRSTPTSTHEASSTKNCAEESGMPSLRPIPERKSEPPQIICEQEGRDYSRANIDGGRLATDGDSEQGQVLLLQEETSANDGSCDSSEQGRETREGERSSSMSGMQFSETRQVDDALLVGCPGCIKCLKYHGYIFHLSAGRPTKSHEYLFLLSKSPAYFYDYKAIMEPCQSGPSDIRKMEEGRDRLGGKNLVLDDRLAKASKHTNIGNKRAVGTPEGRNKRSVWNVSTAPYSGAHFATFPPDLIRPCILAGTAIGDTVLDPFGGSGTTGQVALELGRKAILIELNPEYGKLIERRTDVTPGLPLT